MTPRRVNPPVGALVFLPDLKLHLRVDGDEDDTLIEALEQAAVSHLDGWRGLLGRCTLRQSWEVDYSAAGLHRLPFPDAVSVTASDGVATLHHDSLGSLVHVDGPCTVTAVFELPADALNAVRLIVRLLVAHWYEHREASTAEPLKDTPLAVDALLAPIRWTRI